MREIAPLRNQHPATSANPDMEYVFSPEDQALTLRDYWRMLVKRRRLAALVLVTMLAVGVVVTALTTPLYTAKVTLKIDSNSPSVAGLGELLGGGIDYYQTQVALLKSRALAARVITELNLAANPKFIIVRTPMDYLRSQVVGPLQSSIRYLSGRVADLSGSAQAPEPPPTAFEMGVHPRLIDSYLKLLEVQPVAKTSLVNVLFTSVSPRLSQELAAAHAAAFIRMNLETRFDLTKEAREFLDKKLAELKAKVERSEGALDRFRKAHGVVAVDGSQNIIVERMVDLNKRLTEARSARIELESLARTVKNKSFENLSQIINNQLIVEFKNRIDVLEAEEARLSTIFKPDHPRLVDLKQQLRDARKRLDVQIGNVVRGIDSDYAAARAKEAALQAEADRQQKAALSLKELGVEHTLLQSELDANKAVYSSVLQRLNETSVSNGSPISNMQITEPAERPLFPSSPNILLNMMLASAGGLFFGVGLAFLREHFDSTVRTPEDVWRAAALPTLGVVPHLKTLARSEYAFGRLSKRAPLQRLTRRWLAAGEPFSAAMMVSHHPLSLLAESYRTIRTVLLLGQVERPPQVVLLTSAHPGEGKTTITLNLAITLAQSGRSVIVVDGDLRKGNCHTHLGMQSQPGLTNLLTENRPLEEVVQSPAVPGLSLLSRGAIPPNPTDLLASSQMHELLATLRHRFDFVLIDGSPAAVISDAIVTSAMCDGVMLIVRNQTTTTDAVRDTMERFQAVGAHVLGAVINCIDIRTPDYSAYRRYYSSYYSTVQNEANRQT